jgi:hypothetical protein
MILVFVVVAMALIWATVHYGARPEPRRVPIRVRDDENPRHRRQRR